GNPFHLQSPQRGKFLAGLLVLALVGGVIHSFTTPLARTGSPREKPRAVAGLLDASGWDFSQGNLRLDGEWELYFGRLLEPADFASLPPGAMTGYVPVPGSWRSARTDDGPPPRHGAATYRLRLTGLPTLPGHAPWALEIPYARTAYRLWVNDVLVASNGEVSDDPAAMRPQY